MDITVILGVVVGLLLGGLGGVAVHRRLAGTRAQADAAEAERLLADARREADTTRKTAEIEAREQALKARAEAESGLEERRGELVRLEERVLAKESQVDARAGEVDRRAEEAGERERRLREQEAAAAAAEADRRRALESVSGMTQVEARDALLKETEDQARHDMAKLVRRIEEEARQEADRRARSIVATCIQRTAASHAASMTVAMVELPSDDLKGRIIGREGRNIRALETITGVDVIIDDTPGAVVLSAFDGVRREVARLTLEKLLQDGRIHPARIEEMYYQAKSEIEERVVEAGERASFEANVPGLHPELIKVLGRLNYRTSYGQSVLKHSLECAHLAAIMATELGANEKVARRAALLHDIGKAVTHEVEGSHAVISAQLCRKYKESEAVSHAVEAHHFDVDPQTVEAVLIQAADAISAARPGARGESLENYIKRLEALEEIAMSKPGVDRCYAMQAGRDLRVMVKPGEIDDDEAVLLSREIAREIEESLEYPGQIKITVIRELRASEIAK